MAEVVGVAFDEFVQGGLLDDADVTVKRARWETWDYNGKQAPIFALGLDLEDSDGQVHNEHLSCGELRFFVPSADGKLAVPSGTAKKLNLNTNAVAFILSFMNADTAGAITAAFKVQGDISLLEGVKMHVIRKAQPKRAGLAIVADPATAQPGQTVREKTQLLCEKVLAYVGGAAAPGAVANKTAPAAAAAPAVAADPNEDLAVGALIGMLGENGNTLKQGVIAGKFFSSAAVKAMELTAPVKNAILGIIVKPAFLGASDRPWSYDAASNTVTMG